MDEVTGLTTDEARQRLATTGPNRLPEANPPGLLLIFARQYKSPFIYVLLAAAVVSLALGQTINAVFILAVLLLNASIGAFQEYAAQKAASGLEKMVPHQCLVIRDGRQQQVDAEQLVPGDVVLLASGDKVPADARLLSDHNLQVDESMLTGESVGVDKSTLAGDQVYAGTTVLRGRAQAEITATGTDSELGHIAREVTAQDQVRPPLMQRIDEFTLRVTIAMLILIAGIFLITLLRGDDLSTVFFLGVALAVSAIPEGLPVAITVALSIGMQRMAKRGVIIRNLVAVEALGSCTYIASDKTGTLTVNEMTVRRIVLADGSHYDVSGEGLRPQGEILPLEGAEAGEGLGELVYAGACANEARLNPVDGGLEGVGDAVDQALLILAMKYGLEPASLQDSQVTSIPYESANAFSASLNDIDGERRLYVKGSLERLLGMCRPGTRTEALEAAAEQLAAEGYRVLALAVATVAPGRPVELDSELSGLTLLGLVAMIDPLRPEVVKAVQECREASIKVAMVTGDHPATARELARELGIGRFGVSRQQDRVITGEELARAGEAGEPIGPLVNEARVFARVKPEQKMQIVDKLVEGGEFVAVTGDGINDAPALKHAHIGVAMGKRGCDVARESSDMILTDDNFASIVHGIREGRVVYNNIRKVIFLLISTGAAEITLILLSIIGGLPLPLLPLQLLWLNLVTNGIQDVALVFEPEEGDELRKPPRAPGEPIFNRLMIERVVLNAVVMGCLAFAVFYLQIAQGVDESSARNVTLLLMVLFENVHVFNSRSETTSIFRQRFFGNPFLVFGMLAAQAIHIAAMHSPLLAGVLELAPVSATQWAQLLGIALLLIVVDELHKAWLARKHRPLG